MRRAESSPGLRRRRSVSSPSTWTWVPSSVTSTADLGASDAELEPARLEPDLEAEVLAGGDDGAAGPLQRHLGDATPQVAVPVTGVDLDRGERADRWVLALDVARREVERPVGV